MSLWLESELLSDFPTTCARCSHMQQLISQWDRFIWECWPLTQSQKLTCGSELCDHMRMDPELLGFKMFISSCFQVHTHSFSCYVFCSYGCCRCRWGPVHVKINYSDYDEDDADGFEVCNYLTENSCEWVHIYQMGSYAKLMDYFFDWSSIYKWFDTFNMLLPEMWIWLLNSHQTVIK